MVCPRCSSEGKLKQRSFSAHAVTTLVASGELEEGMADQAICDDCYEDLREALIDAEAEGTLPKAG